MASPDDIEELIKEIAAKHHIAVSRDDPILVLQTINNRLLDNSAKAQQAQLEAFASQLEAISQRWSQDAKTKADRTLTAAVSSASDAAIRVLEEASKTSAALVRAEVTAGAQRIGRIVNRARHVAHLNLIAAFLSVVAAGVALVAVLH